MLVNLLLGASIVLTPGKSWHSEPFPVKGGVQYGLEFRARIDGETTIERNAQVGVAFYDVARSQRGMNLPGWSLEFRTAEGKTTGLGILFPYWNAIWSGEWRTYRDGFNAPWDAATVRIAYHNNSSRDALEAEPPVLSESKSPYVNVNPDFNLGERCHAGFGIGGFGSLLRMDRRSDGKGWYLSVKTWTNADRMPVRGGHAYRFDLKLVPGTKVGAKCGVSFSDAAGKGLKGPGIGGDFIVKGKDGAAVTMFVAPTDAAYMGLHLGKTDFEHVRVTDLGVAK